jgi:hypothetical protein
VMSPSGAGGSGAIGFGHKLPPCSRLRRRLHHRASERYAAGETIGSWSAQLQGLASAALCCGHVEIADVDVPMAMGPAGLVKPGSLFRWLVLEAPQQAAPVEHAVYRGRAGGHDIPIEPTNLRSVPGTSAADTLARDAPGGTRRSAAVRRASASDPAGSSRCARSPCRSACASRRTSLRPGPSSG